MVLETGQAMRAIAGTHFDSAARAIWNAVATWAIGRPTSITWATAHCLPSTVSAPLRRVMERVSSCEMAGFSTTHRADQEPVPSSSLRDYNVMTRKIYGRPQGRGGRRPCGPHGHGALD